MAGRYFDQWQIGDRVAHEVTRTVTETDNVLISTLTHNPSRSILTMKSPRRQNSASLWSIRFSPSG